MGFFHISVITACFLLAVSSSLLCLGDDPVSPRSSYPSFCSFDQLKEFVCDKNYKAAESLLDNWAKEAKEPLQIAFLGVEKAKLLYADQQKTEAQEVFLQALEQIPLSQQRACSEEEKKAFDSLFPRYEESIQSAEASSFLVKQAEEMLRQHPSFLSIELYIAASLANRGQFIEFFDRFFHVFQVRGDCFLSKKTIGVLHLRLFEASTREDRREFHRGEAVRYLQEAFALQPLDSTLLVKLAFILPPKEKIVVLKRVSDDLLHLASPIRRSDCFFLIQQAIDVGEVEVARRLIEKARSWYQYSRALNELSDQLTVREEHVKH